MSTKENRSTGNVEETNTAAAAGTRLDPWFNTYADRALGMKQSEVRSLFSVANRPEVVSLAWWNAEHRGFASGFPRGYDGPVDSGPRHQDSSVWRRPGRRRASRDDH